MGRVHPVKGLIRLIEAWFDVFKIFQDWRLVIVGPDENGYRSKIKSLLDYQAKNIQITKLDKGKAQSGVYFLDGIFGEERWQAYAAADLFIAPSDFENFGQSIAEALMTGLPVITTTGTPWKELQNADCGWWVDPSPSSIASALKEAMALSDSERKAKGQIGKGLVKGFYPEKVAEDMCLLYESILSNDQRI
jgi:glycosyltransferase involved in cell wall biosynthesis